MAEYVGVGLYVTTSSASTTPTIPWGQGSGHVQAVDAIGTVTYHVSLDGVTFAAIKDKAGAAIAATASLSAGDVIPVHPECDGVPYIKIVASVGGDARVALHNQ